MTGTFENHLYDDGGKNNFHSETITYNDANETYTWANRAGTQWTLYTTNTFNKLKVGPDCPNYRISYEVATAGVYGPGNELFIRECE